MLSSSLDRIHGRTTSWMTWYHLSWKAHTIGLRQPWQWYNRPWAAHWIRGRRALNMIIALGQYTWSDYIGCEMLSSPLERIQDWTMSGVTCSHRPWISHTIGGCRAWQARMSHGQHTWLDDIRHGMPSSPLENIHGGTRSSMLCHHRHWEAHSVGWRRVWHAIFDLG